MNWWNLLALLPVLAQLIQLAEDNATSNTTGVDKANAVVTALGTAWDALAAQFKIKESWALVEPALRALISLVVTLFNALGKFTKKTA